MELLSISTLLFFLLVFMNRWSFVRIQFVFRLVVLIFHTQLLFARLLKSLKTCTILTIVLWLDLLLDHTWLMSFKLAYRDWLFAILIFCNFFSFLV